jgi:hypothetical protein
LTYLNGHELERIKTSANESTLISECIRQENCRSFNQKINL